MIKIEISENTPIDALAKVVAFGRLCAVNDEICAAADAISAQDSERAPAEAQPDAPKEKPKKSAFSPEQIRAKGIAAAQAHGQQAVKDILKSFGAENLSGLSADKYDGFAARLAELGGENV